MMFDLKKYLELKKTFFEKHALQKWHEIAQEDPQTLFRAMEYSFFSPGKRIRPILTLAVAEMLKIPEKDVLPIALALEMIHVFSLVHDDLPAMDDDDLRRGQPTNHKVFGEATAILAGDALLSVAFQILTELDCRQYAAPDILEVIKFIADQTGLNGMVAGQLIDLESEGKKITLERLQRLHSLKTGALLKAAILSPAILTAQSVEIKTVLTSYAEAIGLAFQIADDILDIEGGAAIGKDIGSDIACGKSTYPALLGLDGAKQARAQKFTQAVLSLKSFGESALPLKEIARYIVERKS